MLACNKKLLTDDIVDLQYRVPEIPGGHKTSIFPDILAVRLQKHSGGLAVTRIEPKKGKSSNRWLIYTEKACAPCDKLSDRNMIDANLARNSKRGYRRNICYWTPLLFDPHTGKCTILAVTTDWHSLYTVIIEGHLQNWLQDIDGLYSWNGLIDGPGNKVLKTFKIKLEEETLKQTRLKGLMKQFSEEEVQQQRQEDMQHHLGKLKFLYDNTTAYDAETACLFGDEKAQQVYEHSLLLNNVAPTRQIDIFNQIIGYESTWKEPFIQAKHSLAPDIVLQLDDTYTPARMINGQQVGTTAKYVYYRETWLITGVEQILDRAQTAGEKDRAWHECTNTGARSSLIANFLISVEGFIRHLDIFIYETLLCYNESGNYLYFIDKAQGQRCEIGSSERGRQSRAYFTLPYDEFIDKAWEVLHSLEKYWGRATPAYNYVILDLLYIPEDIDNITDILLEDYTTIRLIMEFTSCSGGQLASAHIVGSSYNYLEGREDGPYKSGHWRRYSEKNNSEEDLVTMIQAAMGLLRTEVSHINNGDEWWKRTS